MRAVVGELEGITLRKIEGIHIPVSVFNKLLFLVDCAIRYEQLLSIILTLSLGRMLQCCVFDSTKKFAVNSIPSQLLQVAVKIVII